MPDALALQIEAYRSLLPQIRAEHKVGWVLVAHERLVSIFADFEQAALFAEREYPSEQVLITHTEKEGGMVPFIVPSAP